jgi:prepilin-type N-terminal cleavage/methylation domain-containing protein
MKKHSINKGFTLIELLVVISVIALLSSIILASLSTAKKRANDTKVRAQLVQAKTAVELYISINGGYTASTMTPGSVCTGTMFTDPTSGMQKLTGTAASWPSGTVLSCQSTATKYAITASLSDGGIWCVDSSGVSMPVFLSLPSGILSCDALVGGL